MKSPTSTESHHEGAELSDKLMDEKSEYTSRRYCRPGQGSSTTVDVQNGVRTTTYLNSKTSVKWETRHVMVNGNWVLDDARWDSTVGPKKSQLLKRVYRLLEPYYDLPEIGCATGTRYLEASQDNLQLYPHSPASFAHVLSATGLMCRELIPRIGPENFQYITHLDPPVLFRDVTPEAPNPINVQVQHLSALMAACEGLYVYIMGFEEPVIRINNPNDVESKAAQFIRDYLTSAQVPDSSSLNRLMQRWLVPHRHYILAAFDAVGKVVDASEIYRRTARIRFYNHQLVRKDLSGAKWVAGRGAGGQAGVGTAEYGIKSLNKFSDEVLLATLHWRIRSLNGGLFDMFVDCVGQEPVPHAVREFEAARAGALRATRLSGLYNPVLGDVDQQVRWMHDRASSVTSITKRKLLHPDYKEFRRMIEIQAPMAATTRRMRVFREHLSIAPQNYAMPE